MTDLQILTIAVSVVTGIAAAGAAIRSDARAGKRVDARMTDLEEKMDGMELRLKIRIDNAFDHMKLLLELHETKRHKD